MKKVCVVGGRGFIGSWLCQELISKGYSVSVIDINTKINTIPDVEYFEGDIRNLNERSIKQLKSSQIVYHLAAIENIATCKLNPKDTFTTNTEGTNNILQHCLHVDKFVYISSNTVYGEVNLFPIADETFEVNISNEPYAASKIASELICQSYAEIYKIPIVVIRNFTTYGPRQRSNALVPSLILEALNDKEIKVWSNVSRDLIFVKDCVEALVLIAKIINLPNYQVFNLGTGVGIITTELAKIISKSLKASYKDLDIESTLKTKFICDNTKLKQYTGWKPSTSIEEGIEQTINYLKKEL